MKTQPKFTKFLKPHKPKLRTKFFDQKVQTIAKSVFALVSLQPNLLTIGQIEAARRAIVRTLRIKKNSKLLLRVSPTYPRTSIPLETRMGSGKGSVAYWAANVRNGTILFEISNVDDALAKEAFKKAQFKLPGKYKIKKV